MTIAAMEVVATTAIMMTDTIMTFDMDPDSSCMIFFGVSVSLLYRV